MLVGKGITKSYNQLQVLKGIDIHIAEGEFVSIVGKSGAGKSTLLHLLGTLDTPDSGTIKIKDIDIAALPQKELAHFRNQHIGLIFQFHNLLPEFTALENVCLPAWIGKKHKSKTQQKATELLQLLELGNRLDHKPSQLSGGEQQRVAVARALINEPAIIFADEPTGNLDSKTATELHQLFLKLKQEMNQTFAIVTHNAELADMADRKLTMKDGLIAC
jgi:lipoprotein-releasing system ATP-binding protein